jgi:hypothetical protein
MPNLILTFFYSNYFTSVCEATLEFLAFRLLYAGGLCFSVAERFYHAAFNTLYRQTRSRSSLGSDSNLTPDWENPLVNGRNRRKSHVPLCSFDSKLSALQCRAILKKNESLAKNDKLTPNLYYLTPSDWLFLLIGDPSQVPKDWNNRGYVADNDIWHSIHVPSHWQLCKQQFDVPIYTNTTYPFEFNPPR